MNRLRLQYLLSRLKAGKTEYFDEFYQASKGAVWYCIKKIIYDAHAAEDVMQEAYLAFLKNIGGVKGDPLPFLCTIAKNKALDVLKKDAKIDKSVQSDDFNVAVFDSYSIDAPLLELCKKRLDEEEFFILEHTVIFGYTRVAVARKLNKPIATINRRYNKILEKIKKYAKEVYP